MLSSELLEVKMSKNNSQLEVAKKSIFDFLTRLPINKSVKIAEYTTATTQATSFEELETVISNTFNYIQSLKERENFSALEIVDSSAWGVFISLNHIAKQKKLSEVEWDKNFNFASIS
jgi:hypothetical protein